MLEPAQTLNGVRVFRLKLESSARFFRLRSSSVPVLNLRIVDGNNLLLSWSNTGTPLVLEFTEQLGHGAWRAVEQTPTLANNGYSLAVAAHQATRFFRLRQQSQSVKLTLNLATDTGISANDLITSIASAAGTAAPRAGLSSLKAGFDGAVPAQFWDVTEALDATGNFTLSQTQLDDVYGATLPDGRHALHLIASDATANAVGSADLAFTLDTTWPRVTLTPADGQQDVLPGQLVVAAFNEPVVIAGAGAGTAFPLDTLTVRTLGAQIPGRLVADETGNRLSFVLAADLPGNTTLDAAFVATIIVDRAGNVAVVPTARASFRTANGQGIPGTSITVRCIEWSVFCCFMELLAQAPAMGHVHETPQTVAQTLGTWFAVLGSPQEASQTRHQSVGLGQGHLAGARDFFLMWRTGPPVRPQCTKLARVVAAGLGPISNTPTHATRQSGQRPARAVSVQRY